MSWRGWLVLIVLGLAAPFAIYPVFAMKLLCIGLFASAFGLLLGYAGLLSFGHAAFFGSAAYTAGLLAKKLDGMPLVSIAGGVAIAAFLGLIFGLLAIRRQGIYLTMITLALAQLIYFVVLQAPASGGEDGLHGVPRGSLLGLVDLNSTLPMYYFVFVAFCLGLASIQRIIRSPYGTVLRAIREHEPRAISLGYDADRVKLLAFVLSATLSGLAGSLHALVFQMASLSDVHWHLSGEVVLMTLLGGVGTFLGPLIGALAVVALENGLSDKVGPWVQVIIGCTFVLCVLLFRRGITGEMRALLRRTNRVK